MTVLPALALLLLSAAVTITKTGRDALYISGGGIRSLPLAYLSMSLLAPFFAVAALAGMARWGPRRVRTCSLVLMAAFQCTVPLWARGGPRLETTLLFISIPLAYGVLLSATWLLTAELIPSEREQRIRAFALAGASSMAGSLAGAALARTVAAWMTPPGYFVLGAAALLATAAVVVVAHRRHPRSPAAASAASDLFPAYSTLRTVLAERFVRVLALVVMSASAAGVMIEYLFYLNAGARGAGTSGNAAYFADYYLWLNGAGLLLQLIAAPIVQRHLGLGRSLLAVPALILAASLLFTARLVPAGALRVVEGGLKYSFYRSNWEQSFALLAEEVRGAIKIFVDGMAARLGEGFSALGLMAITAVTTAGGRVSGAAVISIVLVCALSAWTLSVRSMRRLIDRHESCAAESERDPDLHPAEGCALTALAGRRLI